MVDQKLIVWACLLCNVGTKTAESACKICTAFGAGEVSHCTTKKCFSRFSTKNESLKKKVHLSL